VDSVIKRNDVAKKPIELERLEHGAQGQHRDPRGEGERLRAVDKTGWRRPSTRSQSPTNSERQANATDAFDASFLPSAADRKAN